MRTRVQVTLVKAEYKQETVILGTLIDPDGDQFNGEVASPPELGGVFEAELSSSGEWVIKVNYEPSDSSASGIKTGAY